MRSANRFGMTLIEILVAMTILILVSASAALIFRSVSNAWRTGQIRTERYQQARLLIDLFTHEVSSCAANARFPLVGTSVGDSERIIKDSSGDELFFAGTIPGRQGLIERGYWLAPDGSLMCQDDASGDGNYATGDAEICARNVQGFHVSYFDGTDWQSRWNAKVTESWPKAIKFSVIVGKQKPETFETIVNVPTS